MSCGILETSRPADPQYRPPTLVLVDLKQPAALEAVAKTLARSSTFLFLPLVVADAEDPGLARVEALPSVVAVARGVDALELHLLEGIDWVLQGCLGVVPAWPVGGVAEGKPYPEGSGIKAPPAVCAAVNLSLTPYHDQLLKTEKSDVINHGTSALAEFLTPVLAAGNGHTAGVQFETVSPWAEPPWVLSVGATSDEAGMIEAPYSGRGTSTDPGVGPDVLTWGLDAVDPECEGTSFAAARVTFMLAVARAWLLQVAANIDHVRGRQFGCPLVGVAIIDRDFPDQPIFRPTVDWPALPVIEANPMAFGGVEPDELDELSVRLSDWRGARIARKIVEVAARVTSPVVTPALSAPSITPARLLAFIDGLDVDALLSAADLPTASRSDRAVSIFPTGTAANVEALVRQSRPVWSWDVVTSKAKISRWEGPQ